MRVNFDLQIMSLIRRLMGLSHFRHYLDERFEAFTLGFEERFNCKSCVLEFEVARATDIKPRCQYNVVYEQHVASAITH